MLCIFIVVWTLDTKKEPNVSLGCWASGVRAAKGLQILQGAARACPRWAWRWSRPAPSPTPPATHSHCSLPPGVQPQPCSFCSWRPARVLAEYMLQRFAECMTRSIRGMIKWGKRVPLTAGWRGGGLTVLSLVPEAPRVFHKGQKEREEWFWKNGSWRCQMLILPRPRDVSKLGSTPEWGGPRSRGPRGESHALSKVRVTLSFPRTLASAWR